MCYVMLPDSRCAKGELGPGYVMGDGRWNISIRRQPQRLHNTLHLSLAVDKHTQTKRALHFLTNLLIECVCVSVLVWKMRLSWWRSEKNWRCWSPHVNHRLCPYATTCLFGTYVKYARFHAEASNSVFFFLYSLHCCHTFQWEIRAGK